MKVFSRLGTFVLALSLVFAGSLLSEQASAADKQKVSQTVIQNVNIFDGKHENLAKGMSVLIEGNKIAKIDKSIKAPEGVTVIDGGGRTLMPGLSDTHVHIAFVTIPQAKLFTGLPGYAFIRSVVDAEDMLMRGFTSVRDMGGPTFSLKMAIDEGTVVGPRIYPAGAMLTQTAGHGDFRFPCDLHPQFGGHQTMWMEMGYARITDGVPLMLAGVRENLRHGASHIKLAAGGGYASPADPLMGNQYTFDEIKAAVDTAADWGTYVTIHSYHPSSINRAIDAGVKDVGHGQLLDEKTLRRMAKEGVFLSTQPFTVCNEPQLDDFSNSKLAQVCKGTEFVYKTAKNIPELKVTYGTDLFFVTHEMAAEQAKMMERLLKWYEPVEILRMATSTAGELFAMSGMRNPYPEADLGVIKEGAYADMLLVEGNPLKDLKVVTNTDNLKVIMKDGKIYKNSL